MKKPKLSIILPVYNTEKYLKKCLESILNNSFKDYELIIINDGTKDNSEDIILEYINRYKDKIIYIKKENTGLSDTRNVGIKKACGDYISFIDSDDYIETNMYEEMFKKLEEYPFDMVICDLKYVYEKSSLNKIVSSGVDANIKEKSEVKKIFKSYYPAVWNKIYKKDVIDGIEFTKGVWYEDMEFMLKLLPNISSIGVVKLPLYNYLQRESSITYTFNEKLYDIIHNMDRVIEYYVENNLYEEYKEEIEYLYARYVLATFPKRLAKCGNYKMYKEGIDFAFKKLRDTFPSYKNNRYLKEVGIKGVYIKHFNKLFTCVNYLVQNV